MSTDADRASTFAPVSRPCFECSGNDETSNGKGQETGCRLRNSYVEVLFNAVETAEEKAHSHDEKKVGKHAADQ